MITMLMYSRIKGEVQIIRKHSLDVACEISDDDWDIFEYEDKIKLIEFLSKNPILDISCIDVTCIDDVYIAEQVRRINGNMYIILIADNSVSPMCYIKPSIMAGSLLLKPLSEENIRKVLFEAIHEYFKKFKSTDNIEKQTTLLIDNRDGRQIIPYDNINFLEARSKKIYVNTGNREYAFYETLDNLEKILNNDFIRCHRSFIVSKKSIRKIIFSQNLIELVNGSFLPISRTYRNSLKEYRL